MKKFMIPVLLFLFINPFILYSAGDSAGYKRTKWFYSQRYAPFDTISEDFMQNALAERDYIRSGGYHLNPAVGTWQSVGGLTGRINTVKYAGNGILVIGAPNGGIWKNSGSGWTFMDPNGYLKSNTSGAIGVDNSTEIPTIYYGTGEGIYGFIYAYLGNGIYKTTNWGDSWSHVSSGLEKNLQIFRITVRPNNPGHVFAATSKGLFRSTNAGANWNVVSGTAGLHCNDIVFST